MELFIALTGARFSEEVNRRIVESLPKAIESDAVLDLLEGLASVTGPEAYAQGWKVVYGRMVALRIVPEELQTSLFEPLRDNAPRRKSEYLLTAYIERVLGRLPSNVKSRAETAVEAALPGLARAFDSMSRLAEAHWDHASPLMEMRDYKAIRRTLKTLQDELREHQASATYSAAEHATTRNAEIARFDTESLQSLTPLRQLAAQARALTGREPSARTIELHPELAEVRKQLETVCRNLARETGEALHSAEIDRSRFAVQLYMYGGVTAPWERHVGQGANRERRLWPIRAAFRDGADGAYRWLPNRSVLSVAMKIRSSESTDIRPNAMSDYFQAYRAYIEEDKAMLNPEEAAAGLEALVERFAAKSPLGAHVVEARAMFSRVTTSGDGTKLESTTLRLRVHIDEMLDHMRIAAGLIRSMNPRAVRLLGVSADKSLAAIEQAAIRIRLRAHDERVNYGAEALNPNTYEYVNPFEASLLYYIITFAGAAHDQETVVRSGYTVEYPQCEAGECIMSALTCAEPHATPEEIAMVIAGAQEAQTAGGKRLLEPIRSSPWLLVGPASKTERVWSAIAGTGNLCSVAPWLVDLEHTIVIYTTGDHVGRITSARPPEYPLFAARQRTEEDKPVVEMHQLIQRSDTCWRIVGAERQTLATVKLDKAPLYLKEGAYTLVVTRVFKKAREGGRGSYIHLEPFMLYDPAVAHGGSRLAELLRCVEPHPSEAFMNLVEGPYAHTDIETFVRGTQCSSRFQKQLQDEREILGEPTGDEAVMVPIRILPVTLDKDGPIRRAVCEEAFDPATVSLIEHDGQFHRVVSRFGEIDGFIYSSFERLILRRPAAEADKLDVASFDAKVVSMSASRSEETYVIQKTGRPELCHATRYELGARWCRVDTHVWEVVQQVAYKRSTREINEPFYAAFDLETVNDPVSGITRAVMAAIAYDGAEPLAEQPGCSGSACSTTAGCIAWHHPRCLEDLARDIMRLGRQYSDRKVYVFGFNNASFDDYPLLTALTDAGWKLGSKSSITRAGSKLLEIRHENVIIHDLRRYIPGSLAVSAKNCGCKAAKSGWNHARTQRLFTEVAREISADELDDEQFAQASVEMLKRMAAMPASEFMVNEGIRRSEQLRADTAEKDMRAYEAVLAGVAGQCGLHAFTSYCSNDVVVTLELGVKLDTAMLLATDGKVGLLSMMTASQASAECCKRDMRKRGIRLHKPRTVEDQRFLRNAMLAGMSIIFPEFTPRTLCVKPVLLLDVRSLYPFVAQLGSFAEEGPVTAVETLPIDEIPADVIGVYRVRILHGARVPCLPYKPLDHGNSHVTSHCWNYQWSDAETTCCSSIDLHVFKHYGGSFQIVGGWYTASYRRGVFTDVMGLFKSIKQREDYHKSRGEPFNATLRELSKLMQNGLTGKFLELPHLDKRRIFANAALADAFIEAHHLKAKSRDEPHGYIEELMSRDDVPLDDQPDTPRILSYTIEMCDALEADTSIKSLLNGILIYSYARAHLWLGPLGWAYQARAIYAVETDGIQFDRVLFETWMSDHFPSRNPYWIEETPDLHDRTLAFDDPTTLPTDNLIMPKLERLGTLKCREAAEIWARHHGVTVPTIVEFDIGEGLKATGDYGEYVCEAGIHQHEFESQRVAYIAKKFYYLERFGDGPVKSTKCTAKGFGRGAVDAYALTHDEHGARREPTRGEQAAAIDKASVLDVAIYERLLRGEPLDILEHRFNCGWANTRPFLKASYCLKTLSPPWWTQLRVRTLRQSEVEFQTPDCQPYGKSSLAELWLGDRRVIHYQERTLSSAELQRITREAMEHDIEFEGQRYHVSDATRAYLKRTADQLALMFREGA